MDLLTYLLNSPNSLDQQSARRLLVGWRTKLAKKGSQLVRQDQPESSEYMLLDGRITSQIADPQGRGVCVSFFQGPCVVTPNVARTRNGVSLVSLDVEADALVAELDRKALSAMMLEHEPIRDWANKVLQEELFRKTDREWCLAALGGADRLLWFRENYPGYEELFNHAQIASFIGITPVTFSRLRTAKSRL